MATPCTLGYADDTNSFQWIGISIAAIGGRSALGGGGVQVEPVSTLVIQ